MTDYKNRIIIAILGFLVFVIPLYFLCDNTNKEIIKAQDRIEENLQEKLLSSANIVTENLNPYVYLKQEFNKIHKELFPNISEQVLTGVPDDLELKKMYNIDLLHKLINLTKEKYSPISITVGTQNFDNLFAYFSPTLEKELDKNNEKKAFLKAKSYFDMLNVYKKHNYRFYTELAPNKIKYFDKLDNFLKNHGLRFNYYLQFCYKYISRYKNYNRNNSIFYTDYYDKQALYPIINFTISKNTIHGFYSILVPQKSIDPEKILNFVFSLINSDIEVKLDNEKEKSEIIKTPNGFKYSISYPTIFINQVNSYKRLRNIDKTFLLDNKIKLSIKFPKKYKDLNLLNKGIKLLSILSILSFIVLSIIFTNNNRIFRIKLTNKILLVLSLIIFLPIAGLSFFTFIISHNLNEIIEINLRKNLHNSLENYSLLKDEISLKRLSSIFEIKRTLANNDFSNFPKTFEKIFKKDKKKKFWFKNYTSDLFVLNEVGDLYTFDYLLNFYSTDPHSTNRKLGSKNNLIFTLIKFTLKKYIDNLGIYKATLKERLAEKLNKNIKSDMFAISLIDKNTNPKIEENTVSKESIPNKDHISIKAFDSSIYFYAKDKINNKFYLLNRINGTSDRQYEILNKYSEANPFWFKPNFKYAYDSNLAITIVSKSESNEGNRIQIPYTNPNDSINKLIFRIIPLKDSGFEKIKNEQETIMNEWIFSKDSPFVILGTIKTFHNSLLTFILNLVFPILFIYATILILLLNNLISFFINKPINIYKKAIEKLKGNELGTTIKSFSNDEFNSITNAFNEMSVAIKQKEQMKRYVSDRLVQSVEGNEIQKKGNGKLEEVTILSSDIRNFTGISEKYEPSEIVEMLNIYFTKMQQAISNNGGIIDKYIGDAIQAVFYDEPNKENQVIRASKAAIAMRKALKELNEERKSKGLFTIENGIGIDTDFAITGTIGTSEGRKDFSVNGEVIAKAAELETKTKMTTTKILISKKSLVWIATQSTTVRNDGNNTDDSNTLSLNKVYSSSVTTTTRLPSWRSLAQQPPVASPALRATPPQGGALETTNHSSPTTHHREALASLYYQDFDNNSVELIDVRK